MGPPRCSGGVGGESAVAAGWQVEGGEGGGNVNGLQGMVFAGMSDAHDAKARLSPPPLRPAPRCLLRRALSGPRLGQGDKDKAERFAQARPSPAPPPRTNRTRRVLHAVLIGHAASNAPGGRGGGGAAVLALGRLGRVAHDPCLAQHYVNAAQLLSCAPTAPSPRFWPRPRRTCALAPGHDGSRFRHLSRRQAHLS